MKQDYLAYKKKKLTETPEEIEKPMSAKRKYLALGIAVFVGFFIFTMIILNGVFGSKVDIETGQMNATDEPYSLNDDSVVSGETDKKYTIDARLKQLQIEETTPTISQKEKEAKIASSQVKKLEKEQEKLKKEKAKQEEKANKEKINKEEKSKKEVSNVVPQDENKIVYSKVLLGRYSSFEEAKAAQAKLRQESGVEAFVRKMGSVYALQVGSYMNQDQAQNVATQFSNMDYQVWILED
ncbi:SPOR domain-containing protein [bacterium]|nr:SPOR domain-containing protein [bacterium]